MTETLMPLISVVIPVKNGQDTIQACLEALLSQSVSDRLEVIVIDSASTDRTREIVAKYPVKLHEIRSEDFNHGETRNLGVRLAQGQFVVMTVQDAVAENSTWIEQMLHHFEDPRVAGVCGMQIVPHDAEKNPLQWFNPVEKNPQPRRIYFERAEEFTALSAEAQHQLCAWDNVTAMYRRSTLMEIPFDRVSFAEDALWAKNALLRNRALVYEPRARVLHYHDEKFLFTFRRSYTLLYFTHRYFGYVKPRRKLWLNAARTSFWILKKREIPLFYKAKWMIHNIRIQLASSLAHLIFALVLRWFGENSLKKSHAYFCKQAPQATALSPSKFG